MKLEPVTDCVMAACDLRLFELGGTQLILTLKEKLSLLCLRRRLLALSASLRIGVCRTKRLRAIGRGATWVGRENR